MTKRRRRQWSRGRRWAKASSKNPSSRSDAIDHAGHAGPPAEVVQLPHVPPGRAGPDGCRRGPRGLAGCSPSCHRRPGRRPDRRRCRRRTGLRSAATNSTSSAGSSIALQDRQQLPHLLGAPHQRRALDAVGDVGVLERSLELRKARPGGDEHRDVAVAGRPMTVGHACRRRTVHSSPMAWRARVAISAASTARISEMPSFDGRAAEPQHRRAFGHRRAVRKQRLERRLGAVRAVAEQLAEDRVDPVDDAGNGTEVGGEGQDLVGLVGPARRWNSSMSARRNR